jgi:hypothetical protein
MEERIEKLLEKYKEPLNKINQEQEILLLKYEIKQLKIKINLMNSARLQELKKIKFHQDILILGLNFF